MTVEDVGCTVLALAAAAAATLTGPLPADPQPQPRTPPAPAPPSPATPTPASSDSPPLHAAHHPTPGPTTPEPKRTVWGRLADCESGRWDRDGDPIPGTADWNIVSPPHYGGVQFTLRSWRWVGGEGLPSDATRSEQIRRARLLLERQGWSAAWPVCSAKIGVAP